MYDYIIKNFKIPNNIIGIYEDEVTDETLKLIKYIFNKKIIYNKNKNVSVKDIFKLIVNNSKNQELNYDFLFIKINKNNYKILKKYFDFSYIIFNTINKNILQYYKNYNLIINDYKNILTKNIYYNKVNIKKKNYFYINKITKNNFFINKNLIYSNVIYKYNKNSITISFILSNIYEINFNNKINNLLNSIKLNKKTYLYKYNENNLHTILNYCLNKKNFNIILDIKKINLWNYKLIKYNKNNNIYIIGNEKNYNRLKHIFKNLFLIDKINFNNKEKNIIISNNIGKNI